MCIWFFASSLISSTFLAGVIFVFLLLISFTQKSDLKQIWFLVAAGTGECVQQTNKIEHL